MNSQIPKQKADVGLVLNYFDRIKDCLIIAVPINENLPFIRVFLAVINNFRMENTFYAYEPGAEWVTSVDSEIRLSANQYSKQSVEYKILERMKSPVEHLIIFLPIDTNGAFIRIANCLIKEMKLNNSIVFNPREMKKSTTNTFTDNPRG